MKRNDYNHGFNIDWPDVMLGRGLSWHRHTNHFGKRSGMVLQWTRPNGNERIVITGHPFKK